MVVILVVFFSAFIYKNTQLKSTYEEKYTRCLENQNELTSKVSENPLAKECLERGGCVDGCGSACEKSKKSITILEFIQGFFERPKSCIAVCSPECLLP